MTATTNIALNTPGSSADTRPALFIHPRSHQARGRALYYVEIAQGYVADARRNRLLGRPGWARSALTYARLSRAAASYEFGVAKREGQRFLLTSQARRVTLYGETGDEDAGSEIAAQNPRYNERCH